ncbi:MAG: pyridoxal phosphate-dependent decarboxylase family protein [Gemmatimonadota bacterium]
MEPDGTPTSIEERLRRLEAAARPLEPDAGARDRLHDAIRRLAERYLARIANDAESPAAGTPDVLGAYVQAADPAAGLLERPIAERGAALDDVVALLEREVLEPGGHPASPGHLAYLSGGGLYHAALGAYLGAVTNKYPGIFFTGPGPVRMEDRLVRWTADLVGFPDTAAGYIASGGSLANFTAVVTARDARGLRGSDLASTVAYTTSQAHHCIDKALRLAGLAEVELRRIPTDAGHRMRPAALAEAIAEDRAGGRVPWLVVATAGTTDVGAVDPLRGIADVAEREGCWLHVDAAYGGYFLLTEQGRERMAGIERADSAVLDPHKSLFLPWGAGILVVRDGALLADAHGGSGPYLQDAENARAVVSPADLSPELTKPFRALAMWLPLVLLGTRPFAAALEEKLLLARYFRRRVAELGFEVGPPPDLSVATFRLAPSDVNPAEADAMNRRIVDALRRDGRIFLSSTVLDGRFTIRMAALPHRTHRRHVDLALHLLGEEMATERG